MWHRDTYKPRAAALCGGEHAEQEYGMSERHACRLLGQWRGTQRYRPIQRSDEDALTRAIITLAGQYGRYGYRRITALLRRTGWQVGKDRVQRIWRREGLSTYPAWRLTIIARASPDVNIFIFNVLSVPPLLQCFLGMGIHKKLPKIESENLSTETRVDWYRQMCRIRTFEQQVLTLDKAGLVQGTAHLYIGMEAIAVGACAVMRQEDQLTSTHRGHGHCIARGLDMNRMMAEILGRASGYCRGKGGSMHITDISRGMLGADGIVGGGIPIAVGAALGVRLKGMDSVVFSFFGDGACNQGSFHEALNLAGVLRLPVVFICENNLWALSTPFAESTAGQSVSHRAAAYGMAGKQVDGNDVEAVFEVVAKMAKSARQGGGPSLLECRSYRWQPHSIFTQKEIRPAKEIEQWKRRDPIERYRTRVLKSKVATAEALGRIETEVTAEVDAAVQFAKQSPPPDPESALGDIYASERQ